MFDQVVLEDIALFVLFVIDDESLKQREQNVWQNQFQKLNPQPSKPIWLCP